MKLPIFLLLLSVASGQPLLTLIPSGSGSSDGSYSIPTTGSPSGGGGSVLSSAISTVGDFFRGSNPTVSENEHPLARTSVAPSIIDKIQNGILNTMANAVRDKPIEHVNVEEEFPKLFSQQSTGTMVASGNGNTEPTFKEWVGDIIGTVEVANHEPKMGARERFLNDLLGIEEVLAGSFANSSAKALKEARALIFSKSRELRSLTEKDGNEYGAVLGVKNGRYAFGPIQKGNARGVFTDLRLIPRGYKAVGNVHSHTDNDTVSHPYTTYERKKSAFSLFGNSGNGEVVRVRRNTPITALSQQDIIFAYRRGLFNVATLPNGSSYYQHPNSEKTSPIAKFGEAADDVTFGRL